MSNLPISSKYRSTPDRPVPEEEREDLNKRLNEAFSDGRIDDLTYRNLLDRVYSAQTLGELLPVAEVLPPRTTYTGPAITKQDGPPPGELTQSRPAGKMAVYAAGGIGLGIILVGMLLLMLLL